MRLQTRMLQATLLSVLAAFALSSISQDDSRITMPVESAVFADFFAAEARKAGLSVEIINDSSIRYERSDAQKIHEALERAATEFLPVGRSVRYNDELKGIFEEKLRAADINYRVVLHAGSEWIVWDEKDSARIHEIQQDVEAEFLNRLNAN